jgi:hypothetical protein
MQRPSKLFLVSLALPLILGACAHQASVDLPASCPAPHIFTTAPAYPAGSIDTQSSIPINQDSQRSLGNFRGELGLWLGMSNEVARNNDEAKARCAIAWLDTWAQGGHMREDPRGSAAEQQASHNETTWALQSIATAYTLNLRSRAERGEQRRIDKWLRKVAWDVVDAGIEDIPPARQDNQYLWAGTAVMAAGVAVEDEELESIAYKTYQAGIDSIGPDGSLPRLSTQGDQALRGHLQAIIPLTLMAEFAHRQGDAWSHYKPERLPRLVDFTLHGINDPQWAGKQFGALQETAWMHTCSEEWGWTPFWQRYDAQRVGRLLPEAGSCSWLRLGGDLPMLKARGMFEPTREAIRVFAP